MVSLEKHTVQRVSYKNSKDELSDREIIPHNVPSTNIKALDVSALDDNKREIMVNMLKDYALYTENHMKTAFSFDNWLDQAQPDIIKDDIKWRTFKIDRIIS